MDIFYILSILTLLIAVIVFFVFKKKNDDNNKSISEKQQDIDRNIEELNSPINSFDEKLKKESDDLNKRIKVSQRNIISLNKSNEKEDKANYMKNVFLTNVSNEIRNPLNGILGFANILRTDLARLNRDDLYEFADSISQSGESLLRILSDIIDISRLEVNDISFDLVGCEIKEIINKSIENHKKLAEDKGLQLIVDEKLDHTVLSDYETIDRIINSVIDNAVKFTDKGYIKISTKLDITKETLVVNIKDTGIGIDPSYIPMVFEPYRQESLGYTTKYQGAGLSLPLAKRALELMQGEIVLESEKGNGTSVDIRLKVTKKEEIKPKAEVPIANKVEKPEIPWYNKNIFLVEDDKINQILFTKILKGCGNLIISASGEEALENIEELKKEEFKVDFVLMDINLPGEYDGVKLMHELKNNHDMFKNIPFIAQTAYAMSNDKERLLSEGFDDYLSKPIKKALLSRIVEKLLYS